MKIKNLRWIVLSLIALVTIINYLDRGTLNYMFLVGQSHDFTVADEPVEGEYTVCLTSEELFYTFYNVAGAEVAVVPLNDVAAETMIGDSIIIHKVTAADMVVKVEVVDAEATETDVVEAEAVEAEVVEAEAVETEAVETEAVEEEAFDMPFLIAEAPIKDTLTVCETPKRVYTFYDADGSIACTAYSIPEDAYNEDKSVVKYKVNAGIAHDLGLVDPTLTVGEQDEQGKSVLAIITIFFMIAYGISQLVSGKIYDKIGTRKGFSLSAVIWGAADALTSLASGKFSLIGFRMALGLGEAGPWPGTVKSNAEWFPTNERALAQGIFGAAASVGSILAPIIIPLLFIAFGWRVAFIFVGCLGILWVIPWLLINKKAPKDHPWITEKEKNYILDGQPKCDTAAVVPAGKSWGQLLRDPRNYSLILGRFFLDPIWWMFVTWLPIYLKQVFDLNIKDIAASAWIPYVGAAAGSIIGGWFSGFLVRKGKSLNFARKCAMVLGGLIILPGMYFAATATDVLPAVICMAFVLGGFQFAMVNMQTLASDLHSGKTVGSLAGLGGVAAVFGTLIGMWLVPMITSGSNWTLFFVMCGALVPLSLIAVFATVRKIEQIED